MGRSLKFLAALVLAGVAAGALSRAPALLARMDAFRVRDFALEGGRYLDLDEAIRWAKVSPDASVWDDPGPWERRLATHPLVAEASVWRDLPGTLVFRIRERTPVALLAGPTLEPVDGTGETLPLDPAMHRLDLPVIQPRVGPETRGLTAEELHEIAGEVDRLREADPAFLATVSEVAPERGGALVARMMRPRVELRFRPPLTPLRLREALQALDDATSRLGSDAVHAVDLRFEDQVVIRWSGSTARQSD